MARTATKRKFRKAAEPAVEFYEDGQRRFAIREGVSITDPSDVVRTRREHLRKLTNFPVSELVPAHVRQQSAERWRLEQEALEREEYLKEQFTWRAGLRRLYRNFLSALFGPPAPFKPPQRAFPFEG